ncbi:hypothetical protein GPECTOR_15g412 [Gonium pectorale]|uniref:Uncharacterized protein n=1 Tax=Gonium pectorale TaxID=33097 RepID=A0A150GLS0_GONPE|nr:hypothetical protein GPECTOR_15g412 [Gonium pectorale]|eukprot:KXZ50728.1 hypothetical protein GPECTOR_15g412 [Gonium pectorale]
MDCPVGEVKISKLLREVPQKSQMRIMDELWKLKCQVAAKSDEVAAKTKQLYEIKLQLTLALSTAGVVNARSFLEYVVKQWEVELTGVSGNMKRLDVFKDGLRKRPELVECLRREVPTWAPPSMGKERTVENLATNIESIILDANNNIHTFNPKTGLALHKTVHTGPTVAALACLATSMGVLCHIVVKNLATNIESIILDANNNIHTFNPKTGLALHKTVHTGPTVAALACLATSMGVLCHIVVKEDTFISA